MTTRPPPDTTPHRAARGPLQSRRVIELAGIGPAPYCGQLLADMGADIIVIDRPDGAMAAVAPGAPPPIDMRGKRSVVLDLRKPAAVAAALRLVATADILIEGFRPGVAERLGIGPDVCHNVNPKLILRTHDRLGPGRAVGASGRP